MEELKQKDFVEVEFIGKTLDGEVFDSNIQEILKKIDQNSKSSDKVKPFIFSLGQGMFLKSIEDFLIGKPSEKAEYEITLTPEQAFGIRQSALIQVVPMKAFFEQKIIPQAGMIFNFEGRLAKILSVSGGRVIVDFNHPLAGKTVIYNLNVLRKVEDLNEKIKAFTEFLFRREFKFEVNEQEKKIILEVEAKVKDFVNLFSDKFNELFGMNLELKIVEPLVKENNKEIK